MDTDIPEEVLAAALEGDNFCVQQHGDRLQAWQAANSIDAVPGRSIIFTDEKCDFQNRGLPHCF